MLKPVWAYLRLYLKKRGGGLKFPTQKRSAIKQTEALCVKHLCKLGVVLRYDLVTKHLLLMHKARASIPCMRDRGSQGKRIGGGRGGGSKIEYHRETGHAGNVGRGLGR